MPPGVEQWVWVSDFEGFIPTHAFSPVYAYKTASLLTKYYPERLTRIVILRPPWYFDAFWQVMAAALEGLHRSPKDKVSVIRTAEEWEPLFDALMPGETVAALNTMVRRRDPEVGF